MSGALSDQTSDSNAAEYAPVRVLPDILAGLEAVRRDARVSMGNLKGVAEIAFVLGYPQIEAWLAANERLYAHGCFVGFVADDAAPPGGELQGDAG